MYPGAKEPRRETSLAPLEGALPCQHLDAWTSDFQNCKAVNFCCNPPCVWYLVMAGPGNQYSARDGQCCPVWLHCKGIGRNISSTFRLIYQKGLYCWSREFWTLLKVCLKIEVLQSGLEETSLRALYSFNLYCLIIEQS